MLKLDGVDAFYGDLQALFSVSLEVPDGKIMALVGANAAGKSTTIRVISGLLSPRRGRVLFGGEDLARVPAYRRVELGIVQVPEGRRLFPFMTVTENLLLGAHTPHARSAREVQRSPSAFGNTKRGCSMSIVASCGWRSRRGPSAAKDSLPASSSATSSKSISW